MADYSQYKRLELPKSNEKYDVVGVVNKNNMIIDSELHKLDLKNQSQDNLLASKESLNEHLSDKDNPHNVTKSQVGLDNVDNTSDINKPVSTAQQDAIDQALYQSNCYTDTKIAELINGAPETLDTLKEIADAIEENETIVEALDAAIGTKANQSELNTHINNDVIHVTQSNKDNWNAAKTHAESQHARVDATKVEKSENNGNIIVDDEEIEVYTPDILNTIQSVEENNDAGKFVDALVVKEVFQSVSDGKAAIASAITDKGVQADAADTFQTMANNIRNIQSEENSEIESPLIHKIYCELTLGVSQSNFFSYFPIKKCKKIILKSLKCSASKTTTAENKKVNFEIYVVNKTDGRKYGRTFASIIINKSYVELSLEDIEIDISNDESLEYLCINAVSSFSSTGTVYQYGFYINECIFELYF